MNRFKFERADLCVDLEERLFQLMSANCCAGQRCIEHIQCSVGLVSGQESAGDLVDNLLADFAGQVFHSLDQSRCVPVKANDLDFAVHAFRNSEDGLIERAAGNRHFFMDSSEKFKAHSLIRSIMSTLRLRCQTEHQAPSLSYGNSLTVTRDAMQLSGSFPLFLS